MAEVTYPTDWRALTVNYPSLAATMTICSFCRQSFAGEAMDVRRINKHLFQYRCEACKAKGEGA